MELGNNYVPGVYDGVKEPKQLPDLEENRKTLEGIDSNGDGVRDDAEIYINRNFEQDYDRIIYKTFMRRGALFLKKFDKLSIEQIRSEMARLAGDLECIRFLYEYGYFMDVKERTSRQFSPYELLYDTEKRLEVEDKSLRMIRVTGSNISTAEEAYAACPESIKKKYPMKRNNK